MNVQLKPVQRTWYSVRSRGEPEISRSWTVGTIDGLSSAAHYNGLLAKVVSHDAEAARYTVMLDEGKTLGSYRALIDKERAQWMKPYAGVIWIAAEGHIQPAEEKFGGQQKHPGYYESASAATNIFHRRNSMKL